MADAASVCQQFLALVETKAKSPTRVGITPDTTSSRSTSLTIQAAFKLIERTAQSDQAILIPEESGTGKALVPLALREHSPRTAKPMVAINCTALTEMLLESELISHKKGAYTGAIAAMPGLFELADGGTLFIDEIGEMPGSMQAKRLCVLEK